MVCTSHPAMGFRKANDLEEIEHPSTKYSYIQEAGNRLLMNIARSGYKILHGEIFMNEVPNSRELVNMVGAHIKTINILHKDRSKDDLAFAALQLLERNNILKVSE